MQKKNFYVDDDDNEVDDEEGRFESKRRTSREERRRRGVDAATSKLSRVEEGKSIAADRGYRHSLPRPCRANIVLPLRSIGVEYLSYKKKKHARARMLSRNVCEY